jgi:hypothetical protein
MSGFTVTKHGRSRFWALRDRAGDLVCLCVYKRGALEVARRLGERETPEAAVLRETPPEAVGAGKHGFPKIPLDSLRLPSRESSRSVQMDNNKRRRKDNMKNSAKNTKEAAAKDQTMKAKARKGGIILVINREHATAKSEPAAKEDGWQKAQELAAGAPAGEGKVEAPKVAKSPKAKKPSKAAKGEDDAETGDRLPGNLDELKSAKGGLVASLFLAGKDKEAIAAELKRAFSLEDGQAAKIVRRIIGRVRLYRRIFELHGLLATK